MDSSGSPKGLLNSSKLIKSDSLIYLQDSINIVHNLARIHSCRATTIKRKRLLIKMTCEFSQVIFYFDKLKAGEFLSGRFNFLNQNLVFLIVIVHLYLVFVTAAEQGVLLEVYDSCRQDRCMDHHYLLNEN